MRKINFLVTDILFQQIEEVMSRLGIRVKSEFFRMLALACIKENKVIPKITKPKLRLTPKEKTITSILTTKACTIDDLVMLTGLPIAEISSLLIQLLLKDVVTEEGINWKLNKF
ncbi:MAG: hypothetical protein V1760_03545 [Candidatus Peregrinibacteria bacterium]